MNLEKELEAIEFRKKQAAKIMKILEDDNWEDIIFVARTRMGEKSKTGESQVNIETIWHGESRFAQLGMADYLKERIFEGWREQ